MQLAALGAELILGCRDIKKGEQTAEITKAFDGSNTLVMHIDTSSRQSIRSFAAEIRHKYRRLDVLINNAGGNRGTSRGSRAWTASS